MGFRINMLWDNTSEVWIATSQDVPGLVLESGSFDALVERVKFAIPELIELNGQKPESLKLSYIFCSHQAPLLGEGKNETRNRVGEFKARRNDHHLIYGQRCL